MNVNGVNSASTYVSGNNNATADKTADLGIDDFFKLMAAQLQNQSMFDSVDNTQFLAQMAQFSSLSQISELNNTIQANMAISLIGKAVSVSTIDSAGIETIEVGKVEQISFNGGVPYVYVNGGFYQLSDIMDIANGDTTTEAVTESEIINKAGEETTI
ncbi:MAG: hypothetical protein A2Y17_04360 [Clostridiales bacterium GWF2_38_85]|nr:MAG: hypothetical protein A2Y17_04360 [Clostridiales bacterium GWF2_38_85]HBL83415.1 hypothetical protein [Clostridiales bacterium]